RNGVAPVMYMAMMQVGSPGGSVYLARGAITGAMLDTGLKRIDSKLHAEDMRTLEEHLSRTILRERMMGTLSGFFGALSLLLFWVGSTELWRSKWRGGRRRSESGWRWEPGRRRSREWFSAKRHYPSALVLPVELPARSF